MRDAGADPPDDGGLLVRFASRISRHTAIYIVGTSSVLVFGVVQVAVYTHYLPPAQYGLLAVYVVIASFLTIIYNLVSLQGTLMAVFGTAEGGEDGGDFAVGDGRAVARPGTQRRILATGLAVTVGVALAGTALVWTVAPAIGRGVIGPGYTRSALLLAAASGALGAIWRLVTNVPRLERRPIRFAILNNLRPALMIACTIPLVALGRGVNGALLGMVIGGAVSVGIAMLGSRSSYEVALAAEDVRLIARRGVPWVPVVVGLWVVHNADIYFLSRYVKDAEVGTYRLAARLSSFGSYFVSAFLMSWAPLERTSLFRATYARRGRAAVRSMLVTYYVIAGMAIVLAMSLGADALVAIAPPAYASAADLIPLLGIGFVAYGGFNVLARTGIALNSQLLYPALSTASAVVFVAAAIVLIPWLGAYGAALTLTVGMAPGILLYAWFIRRSPEPVPLAYRDIALSIGTAFVCFAFGDIVGRISESARPFVDVLAFLTYPAVLVLSGVVPRAHLRPLVHILRAAFPQRRDRTIAERVAALDAPTARIVRSAVEGRYTLEQIAQSAGLSEQETSVRLTYGLASLAGIASSELQDPRVVDFLLWRGSVAERDALVELLCEDGVDPAHLDALESVLSEASSLPVRDWADGRPEPVVVGRAG